MTKETVLAKRATPMMAWAVSLAGAALIARANPAGPSTPLVYGESRVVQRGPEGDLDGDEQAPPVRQVTALG